ncbi:hypothetical protein GGR55DRAFT_251277 [Xylaria sp. FL0064]|nr:hypothetical protein GGR55DRAFT_251277 [Xylaria sp. FL0064]
MAIIDGIGADACIGTPLRTNATLQLQRLADEEAGFGTWSNCAETAELLGALSITNADHPILKPPSTGHDLAQAEDAASQELAPSPTITCSSLPLQPIQSTCSHKTNVELP